jgi:hypothetical protein
LHADFDCVCILLASFQKDGKENKNIPRGWHTSASIIPAAPPAVKGGGLARACTWYYLKVRCWKLEFDIPIKFVAAEAGFLPFGPFTFLADILRESVGWSGVCACEAPLLLLLTTLARLKGLLSLYRIQQETGFTSIDISIPQNKNKQKFKFTVRERRVVREIRNWKVTGAR